VSQLSLPSTFKKVETFALSYRNKKEKKLVKKRI